jgi:hypothetical protein
MLQWFSPSWYNCKRHALRSQRSMKDLHLKRQIKVILVGLDLWALLLGKDMNHQARATTTKRGVSPVSVRVSRSESNGQRADETSWRFRSELRHQERIKCVNWIYSTGDWELFTMKIWVHSNDRIFFTRVDPNGSFEEHLHFNSCLFKASRLRKPHDSRKTPRWYGEDQRLKIEVIVNRHHHRPNQLHHYLSTEYSVVRWIILSTTTSTRTTVQDVFVQGSTRSTL